MSLDTDIKNMSAPEKAKLFSTLQNDKELQDYMISNKILFEELNQRDKVFAEGKQNLLLEDTFPSALKSLEMLFKVLKYDIVDLEVENVLLYYDSISTELGIRFQTEVEST